MNAAAAGQKTNPAFLLGFVGMIMGNFMALLDIQIVASAIGAIQAGTSASRDEVSWVQTSYLIAEVIAIPLSGFLAKAMGTRRLFCLSSALFTMSSLLCSLAWDINSLVWFRVLQGFTGAAMVPLTISTVYILFAPGRQSLPLALMGTISMLAPTIGPTFGGYIAEGLGWRALFWINVIPGIFATWAAWTLLGEIDKPRFELLRKIDVPGLIGLALFLGAAEYVLEEGAAAEWYSSSEIWFWTMVSATGAAIFFWRATTSENPILDLRPFKSPLFIIGMSLAFVMGVSLFVGSFLLPVFLSSVRQFNSLQVGETMFAQGLTMLMLGPIFGFVMRNVKDLRWTGAFGFVCLAVSSYQLTLLTAETGLAQLWVPQALRGVGFLFIFSSIMQPALQALPTDQVHAATGIFATVRNIGGAFGIAGLTTLQHHAYALHRQELYAAADPNNPHIAGMIQGTQAYLEQAGASDPAEQAIMRYASLLDREALVMTFNDQFMVLAVISILSAVAMIFLRAKPRASGEEAAVAAAH